MQKKAITRGAAFTLSELLVTMAILVSLILLIVKLVGSATEVVALGQKHIDADSQARAVLDRMGVDLSALIQRGDVDYYFAKQTGNDQCAFYSETAGYYPADATGSTPKSSVSVVGYRILNNQLERLNKALVWNGVPSTGSPMAFLPQTLTATWTDISGNGADPDYQVLGDQIYRFEFCFLMRDGTLSDQPWLLPNTTFAGLEDINNIVVAIAVLDNKSRVISADLAAAADKLQDVTGTNIPTTPGELWQQNIRSGDLGLPRAAASQVRIYQRYFSINSSN
jgi:type II secretory pathway component PulJ